MTVTHSQASTQAPAAYAADTLCEAFQIAAAAHPDDPGAAQGR
jgi:hypothetical protein